MKDKGKLQDALKDYDSKEYKRCRKNCDKILEKNPSNQEAMALKGLALQGMGKKEEGEKLLKESLKLNMKNSTVWQFYAVFNKENKNFNQASKCYSMAHKNDPNNFSIIRDVAYLSLFLRKFDDFLMYSKEGLKVNSTLVCNWIQYSFALYLTGHYDEAIKQINAVKEIGKESMKKSEYSQVALYKAEILYKMGKYKEVIEELEGEIKEEHCSDRYKFYDFIIKSYAKIDNREKGIEYAIKMFGINPENIETYIHYFNLKYPDIGIKNYEDLMKLKENSIEMKNLYTILRKEIEPLLKKAKIIERLELILSSGDEFRKLFIKYLVNNISKNLPSIFKNIVFVYSYQTYKLPIISDIIEKNLESIEKKGELNEDIFKDYINELPNRKLEPLIIWVYYLASQHYQKLGNSEKALIYINKAIDSTPSVVEFYSEKAKILKHCLLLEENILANKKAYKLDLSDRYLNAKLSKSYLRDGKYDKARKTMNEFVKDPNLEVNLLRYQNIWYSIETGICYLRSGLPLHSYFIFHSLLLNFREIREDQSDFFGFSLRKMALCELSALIEFGGNLGRNTGIVDALSCLDMVRNIIQGSDEEKIKGEWEELKKSCEPQKFVYTDFVALKKAIDDDIYEFLDRIQPVTDDKRAHYLCVKEYCLKNRPIKALKSLLLLLNTKNKGDFFSCKAYEIFNDFLKKNEKNLDEIVIKIIKNKMSNINGKLFEKCNEEKSVNSCIHLLISLIYNSSEKNLEELRNNISSSLTKENIRAAKAKEINELLTLCNVYGGSEFSENIKNDMKNKAKIILNEENNNDDNKENNIKDKIIIDPIKGNLTLWQSEEEAMRLFPNSHHVLKEGNEDDNEDE